LRLLAFLREPFKHIKNQPASQILPKPGQGDSRSKARTAQKYQTPTGANRA
jgi:hypothetical protein